MRNNLENLGQDYLRPKKIFALILSVILFLIIIFSAIFLIGTPRVTAISPKETGRLQLNQNIEIAFNKPFDRNDLDLSIEPKVDGVWEFSEKILTQRLAKRIIFKPNEPYQPDQTYTITIKNVKGVISTSKPGKNYTMLLTTQKIPGIKDTSLDSNSAEVAICDPIIVTLDQPNDQLADFDFHLSPENLLKKQISADNLSYTLIPEPCLAQGQDYSISIDRTVFAPGLELANKPVTVYQTKFKTKGSPGIADFTPKGSYVPTNTREIKITFVEPMNKDEVAQNISIKPALTGSWSWPDDRILIFTPTTQLAYDTTYSVEIIKGVHDQKNGFIAQNISLSFKTIGPVLVTNLIPKNGSQGVTIGTSVSTEFDQAVDQNSAQKSFQITPATTGTFSWVGNKMIFKPTTLLQNTQYLVTVISGVKSISGLPSAQNFTTKFTTQQTKILLNVGQDYQDSALSCEAASLKMVLSYRGLSVTEGQIMDIIGFDPTPHVGNVWGNPYNAFVGDINGKQNTTGYGVYWGPIAKAGSNWRATKAFTNSTINNLAQEITNGNPIIIWGTFGNAYLDPWQTSDGQAIKAWKGEHARVVTGFVGTVENPTQFYLNDPVAGKIIWSKDQLIANWSSFDNSGVIVY